MYTRCTRSSKSRDEPTKVRTDDPPPLLPHPGTPVLDVPAGTTGATMSPMTLSIYDAAGKAGLP